MTSRAAAAVLLARIKAQSQTALEALIGIAQSVEAMERELQTDVQHPFEDSLNATSTVIDRSKSRSKIDLDPELEVFIAARILSMTLHDVTAAVAAHFPPDRHVTASSIQRWWHRRGKPLANAAIAKS